jgi:hypothetical protein
MIATVPDLEDTIRTQDQLKLKDKQIHSLNEKREVRCWESILQISILYLLVPSTKLESPGDRKENELGLGRVELKVENIDYTYIISHYHWGIGIFCFQKGSS